MPSNGRQAGASVLAVLDADHKELRPSVFLVLGLGARDAISAFVAELLLADAHREHLVRGDSEIHEITCGGFRPALTEFLIVTVCATRIAMRTQLHLDARTVAEEIRHQ